MSVILVISLVCSRCIHSLDKYLWRTCCALIDSILKELPHEIHCV